MHQCGCTVTAMPQLLSNPPRESHAVCGLQSEVLLSLAMIFMYIHPCCIPPKSCTLSQSYHTL